MRPKAEAQKGVNRMKSPLIAFAEAYWLAQLQTWRRGVFTASNSPALTGESQPIPICSQTTISTSTLSHSVVSLRFFTNSQRVNYFLSGFDN